MTSADDLDDGLLTPADLDARTSALQATVAGLVQRPCAGCGASLCGHTALCAVVLGYREAARCLPCLAAELREAPADLAARTRQWIVRRTCFDHVWQKASADEGVTIERPACLEATGAPAPRAHTTPAAPAPAAAPVATYDAGDLGCGDLVLELRLRMRELAPGAVLHVVARDPAAPVDLPAWCGLVGHTLLRSEHPHYHLQRKRD